MKYIADCTTGEVIVREMTAEEITEEQIEQAERAALEIKTQEVEAAKAAERQAILDRLGLTAEEAQLLLGSN